MDLGAHRNLSPCPGLYCGRMELTNESGAIGWSACGACPRGFRNNASSVCVPCTASPLFYDWLYLTFMVLLAPILNSICVDFVIKSRTLNLDILLLHLSGILETAVAAFTTLLMFEPVGSLNLHMCRVVRLSDWYTVFYNPTPRYTHTLHCAQEAVYPLYTIIFVYYTVSLMFMLLFRPLLARRLSRSKSRMSIYSTMYVLPVLVITHSIGAGLIYSAFSYLTIVLSVVSCAVHFAFQLNQSMRSLVRESATNVRNVVILLVHWLIHAFGIVAVSELRGLVFHLGYLCLVPFPAVFYVVTSRFTNPNKLTLTSDDF